MKRKITVVGLGYVGFPLALELSQYFEVVGYDTNKKKIDKYKRGINVVDFDAKVSYEDKDIMFTSEISDCVDSNMYIVAVPTPIDANSVPDMSYLLYASVFVGNVISKGDIVVYESTVHPGATEDECIPIVEKVSCLTSGVDFKYGYSPERVSPGTKAHEINNIVKVISACDNQTLDVLEEVYAKITSAGVYRTVNIATAEACKITENVQRDVNIALINELSELYYDLGIDINNVLDAASTKWNFHRYEPGMVGGHCISVDPYYLLHKSKERQVTLSLIEASRKVNDTLYKKYTRKIVKKLLTLPNEHKRVLLLGAAYKEDIGDFRNTQVGLMYEELVKFGLDVTVVDDYVDKEEFYKEYNIKVKSLSEVGRFDLIFIYQPHKIYRELTSEEFKRILSDEKSVIVDYKGALSDEVRENVKVV